MTPATGLGPAVFVVIRRAAVQAPSPLPQVQEALPTAQTFPAATTRTLAAGGVTALTNPAGGVAEVTDREREGSLSF